MTSTTPARPWAVWLGDRLYADSRAGEGQAKIAHGICFSVQQQTDNQIGARAS